tara:strand:+ start:110 stop:1138 length:1029 start_codon:yes stop_codon:yes gene_type:complete
MNKYIYSVGIHKEGGLNILKKFIAINNEDIYYFLDDRVKNKIIIKNSEYVSRNLIARLIHLFLLSFKLNKKDHIIFLNGLPPIFNFKSNISVIFQNANLFIEFYQIKFFKWFFSKDSLRYLFFWIGKKNVNNWYVFSSTANKILSDYIKKYVNIKTIDIFHEYKSVTNINLQEIKYDFIYPASFMEHKNHKMLINILISLSKKKIFPKVLFTLDPIDIKKINIQKLKSKYGLKLYNYYEPDQKKFLEIYKKCRSLLYISLNETIGLPIIEANKYGLIIITPELEYGKQFIDPDITFNIDSENELSLIIENCLRNNFNIKKKNTEINILKNSISINDFICKVI